MADEMKRVAVLVSGGGTNLQALIDAGKRSDTPHAELAFVVSSRADAGAINRAGRAGIPVVVLARADYETSDAYDAALYAQLGENRVDVVVLAGFLPIVGPRVLSAYPRRIINIHPSLVPRHCGKGMYGLRVHESVLASGDRVTGATVHLVSDVTDGGEVLMRREVQVLPGDTPKTLQRRVMEQAEWKLLPEALEKLCSGAYEEESACETTY